MPSGILFIQNNSLLLPSRLYCRLWLFTRSVRYSQGWIPSSWAYYFLSAFSTICEENNFTTGRELVIFHSNLTLPRKSLIFNILFLVIITVFPILYNKQNSVERTAFSVQHHGVAVMRKEKEKRNTNKKINSYLESLSLRDTIPLNAKRCTLYAIFVH